MGTTNERPMRAEIEFNLHDDTESSPQKHQQYENCFTQSINESQMQHIKQMRGPAPAEIIVKGSLKEKALKMAQIKN